MEIFNNVYGYFADFVNKLSLFNKKLAPFADLNKAFDSYKKSFVYFKIPQTEFNLDLIALRKKGDIYSLFVNNNPKTLKQLVRAQEWLKYSGNVIDYLKELGFPNVVLNNLNVKLVDADFRHERSKYLGFTALADVKSRINITNDMYKVLGNIDFKTVDVFIDVLQKNSWLKKQFDEYLIFLKTVYSLAEAEELLGDWIKAPAPKNVDINSLFDAIKRHQKRIKGCWAVKYTGEKCLVDVFSCKFLRKNPEICENKLFECPNKGCGCKNSKSCSKLCSNLNTPVPFDTTLICIKGTFWLAAQDYMNALFDVPPPPLVPVPPNPIPPPIEPASEEEPVETEEPDTKDIPALERSNIFSSFSSKWVWVFAIIILIIVVIWVFVRKNRY